MGAFDYAYTTLNKDDDLMLLDFKDKARRRTTVCLRMILSKQLY